MVTGVLDARLTQYDESLKDSEPGPPQVLRCCYILPKTLGHNNVDNFAEKGMPSAQRILYIVIMCGGTPDTNRMATVVTIRSEQPVERVLGVELPPSG